MAFLQTPIQRGIDEISDLLTILIPHFRTKDCCICGGFARYMCSTAKDVAKPSDIDIYFYNNVSFESIKTELMLKGRFNRPHETNLSVTLKKSDFIKSEYPIQLIKPKTIGYKFYGEMRSIINKFDFTIISCGIQDPNLRFGLADVLFNSHERQKLLRVRNYYNPVETMIRVVKYAQKGYKIHSRDIDYLFMNYKGRKALHNKMISSDITTY